jgi:hypothetical protein
MSGTPLAVKPDLVLEDSDGSDPAGSNLIAWNDVLIFCELSKLPMRPDLLDTLYTKAQLNRRFVFALSITNFLLPITLFDRSGAAHSLPYHIHNIPVALMGILSGCVYLSTTHLSYKPTVVLPKIPPHFSTLPQTIPSIKVGAKTYHIIKPIFARAAIRGRATTCWHVQDPNTFDSIGIRGKHPCFYVVKDTWSIAARSSVEEEILEILKDIRGVPKLVKSWNVQVSGIPDTTGPRRKTLPPGTDMPELRVHRCLLLKPYTVPITYFSRRMELLECLIDVINGMC